ncbi:MAG: NAD(P)-dependent oxidoreductase [Gemmatimonadetes bacterium]|jgi:nucleoside-diphosphate-sugar epimerase|nr:NAD(P)-dependent oxidoreductase [Gemmatimonadota bacterium]MBT6145476.1 NAD(P)-dependent oxidoreductase [Gemmatimonadota bacterium]MBT7860959.1 NAD(P)-dependent oxidoreductase [Gemmatimonadota bacterium]
MSSVLITGASGFIGQALAASMAQAHDVLCMSRKDPGLDLEWIGGDFGSFEDLRQLDDRDVNAVIHLGAVTGGCTEHDGIMVNVEGSRCLMRYLIDRGCQKFVMASSIAVVGMQSMQFRPLQVPVPDEHPCLDRDGYGLSKALMEEITRYHQRQNPQIDVCNLRLAAIVPDENPPPKQTVGPPRPWGLGGLAMMTRSNAVRAFTLAAEAPLKPGVRVMNATSPRAWAEDPVADILRNWWGDDVDLSHFSQAGHEYDAVYEVSRIRTELGFVADC